MTAETNPPVAPQPTPAPIAPAVPAVPAAPVSPAPTLSEGASELLLNFRAIDRKQQGAGLHQIRQFYPQVGWDVILKDVKELQNAGLLETRKVLNDKGGVSHELYTWKAV